MDELLEKFNNIEQFHWWWKGRRSIIKKIIDRLVIKPQHILDIGCGTGETLNYLKKILPKAKLTGIDESSIAVKLSQQNTKTKIIKGSALQLPFKDSSFDLILLLDVLEHIKRDGKVISEAKRVLDKNGVIIITCPATTFIWSRHDTRQGHIRRYSISEVKKLAKKTNLKIDLINYFNFFLFLPISAIRISQRLPFLASLSQYDNTINYSIARVGVLNRILSAIILFEVRLMFLIRFPIGISVVAVLKK